MNRVRQDKATQKWVIYAPARDERPRVVHLSGAGRRDTQPDADPRCPFCPSKQIRPRLTTQAGFEIGSGIGINPSLPEEDAAFLRRE